eukprot:182706_1
MRYGQRTIRITKSQRAGLQFPVSRIQTMIKNGNYTNRVNEGAAVYLTAVLEYITAEVLELAGNSCKDCKRRRIQDKHIFMAFDQDDELKELITKNTTITSITKQDLENSRPKKKKGKGRKANCCDDDIYSEKLFGTMRRG